MAGIRDLLPYIPPILIANLAITNPATTLSEARILGSTDPTYGTFNNGWAPRLDGRPFVIIDADEGKYAYPESNREWVTYRVTLFLAIDHADTATTQNYDDLALAWADALSDLIPAHWRLDNAALLVPFAADIRWVVDVWRKRINRTIIDVPYYGIEMDTSLTLVRPLTYAL